MSEYFIVFVLNSVAMLTICVCNGFFQVSKKKALLTLYIPAIACVVLFLVYSIWCSSMTVRDMKRGLRLWIQCETCCKIPFCWVTGMKLR